MLVYVNSLKIEGINPAGTVLRSIAAWFSEKFGEKLNISDIVDIKPRKDHSKKMTLQINKAFTDDFNIYSWTLRHPDSNVHGRQWVTELGLKDYGDDGAKFTCSIYVDAISTMVNDEVPASRPRIIKIIQDNVKSFSETHFANGTVGLSFKEVGNNIDSYKALLAEIERESRDSPLVILSPNYDGDYFVKADKLQQMLFGIAQVVKINQDFNSYEMSDVLGENFSAWGGAINVIKPKRRDKRIFNQLILDRDLPEELNHYEKCNYLLQIITHSTNVAMHIKRIRPEGVKSLYSKLKINKRLSSIFSNKGDVSKEELELFSEEIESLTSDLEELISKNKSMELTLNEKDEVIKELEKKLKTEQYNRSHGHNQISGVPIKASRFSALMDIATNPNAPKPIDCLEALSSIYKRRLIVLESAFESANDSDLFAQGYRLLDLLNKLIKDYLPIYLEKGDNEARKVFTQSEYSPRESDTLKNNKQYLKYRIFNYNGKEIEMQKHLKIGVANDRSQSIRIHFEIDQVNKRVIIGHCGEHLPLPTVK